MMRLSFLAATSLLALSLSSPRLVASQCVDKTSALYESGNGELLDAANNFASYIESLCLSSEGSDSETTPCKMPDMTDMLGQSDASIDFTETHSDKTFIAYKEACLNSGGKLCDVDAKAVVSITYFMSLEVPVAIVGYPLCSAKICSMEDTKDIANKASSMLKDNYPDVVNDITFEITGYNCDAGVTNGQNRALRGAVSH